MERELPQPQYQPSTPPSGWWKAPSSLATDPVFLRVPDELRLAAVGAYTAAVGWCVQHEAAEGWIPNAAIMYGQVCAAPTEQLRTVVDALVTAGLLLAVELDGMKGYVVAGAVKAVTERFARQKSASNAGTRSAEVAAEKQNRYPQRRPKIDANTPVDWSKEDGTF